MCLAGLFYLLLVRLIVNKKLTLKILPLLVIGLAMRLLFLPSTPIYEDDFYRYFFDGSLSSHGLNPYQYTPQDALPQTPSEFNDILGIESHTIEPKAELDFLSTEPLMERVAYPHISTIYPSIAQAVFALSYQLKSFDLTTWRLLLLIFDLISFALLIQLLRHLQKPITYSAVYWLNPLLITETINAAHMDILIIPALLGTLLLVAKQRFHFAGLTLAIAVAIKLWPVLLIPSVFKPLLKQPKKRLTSLLLCLVVITVLLMPQLLHYANVHSGLQNYSEYWRTNSFLFGLLEDALLLLEQKISYYFGQPQAIARYIIAGVMVILIAVLFFKKQKQAHQTQLTELLAKHWLVIITAMFFLSPTGYPWYFIWFLPLLVLKPNMPLLLLTMLLPLYDLRYPLTVIDEFELFNDIIITIEFLPTLILLAVCLYRQRFKKL